MNTLPLDGSLFRASPERPAPLSLAPPAGDELAFRDHLQPAPSKPPAATPSPSNQDTPGASRDAERETAPTTKEQGGSEGSTRIEQSQERDTSAEEENSVDAASAPEQSEARQDAEEAHESRDPSTEEGNAEEAIVVSAPPADLQEAEGETGEASAGEVKVATEEPEVLEQNAAGQQKQPLPEEPVAPPRTNEEESTAKNVEAESPAPTGETVVAEDTAAQPSVGSEAEGIAESTASQKSDENAGEEASPATSKQKATGAVEESQPADGEEPLAVGPEDAAETQEVADARTERSRRNSNRKTSGKSGATQPKAAAAPQSPEAKASDGTPSGAVQVPSSAVAAVVEETTDVSGAESEKAETKQVAVPKADAASGLNNVETKSRNPLPTRPTAAAGPGEPRLTAAERGQFVQRVARAVETAQVRGGPIRLRLSPPELGSVQVEITIERGVLTARLEAETAHARQLLLEHAGSLRERLAGQQIHVERFDVELAQQQTGGDTLGRQLTGDEQQQQRQGSLPQRSGEVAGQENENKSGASSRADLPGNHHLNVVV